MDHHSPLYWAALGIAGILILLDIYGDGAEYTTIGALVAGGVAVLARPGGPLGGRSTSA